MHQDVDPDLHLAQKWVLFTFVDFFGHLEVSSYGTSHGDRSIINGEGCLANLPPALVDSTS